MCKRNAADENQNLKEEIEEVKRNLSKTTQGQVSNIMENYLMAFEYDPILRGLIRKNCLTERVDIVGPVAWKRDGISLTDTDLAYIMNILEVRYDLKSEKKLVAAIRMVANNNRYHPVLDCLNALEWDGVERIRHALHYFFGVEENEYSYECMLLFMLGAISRVANPGCKFERMLCLVGGQGVGKSTFFRFLAINDDWFTDDLKKLDDENVYRKMAGHWIIEMSEMIATANARSIEDIKSFISRQKETYKHPYDRYPEDRKRQCVFGGTTNSLRFLPFDRSGNRRFLPIRVNMENADVHILHNEEASRAYINQMWAEAMVIYRRGEFSLELSDAIERELKDRQDEFMPEDTDAGQIIGWLENFKGDKVCSKQLYCEALGNKYTKPKKLELQQINDIMNNSVQGWVPFENPRNFANYGRQRGWERV